MRSSAPVFFRWDISAIILLKQLDHCDISVIFLTVVLKLAVIVFINIYFQTL